MISGTRFRIQMESRSMPEHSVILAHKDGVALVTLNNPPLNVVTLEMTRELDAMVSRLAGDPAARVMVLTGSGAKAFCAGSDIKEFPQVADAVVAKKLARENAAYSRLADFPKPTIAALNGLAFGGGLELAACCDLIVAEAGSMVALPEIKLGVFPGSGGTIRVTRRIGEGRAKEMMFFGEPVPVETAQHWGLVNRVVAPGEAVKTAVAMAGELADRPNVALQLCKQSIGMAFDRPEREGVDASLALSDRAFRTADCAEGVRAFFAKEAPRFQHR
jgi:enoyl-CoA hydratase/carnithine racemase